MNKHLIALASALLITGTAPAFAASTVDLTVKGIITPNACTPTLSSGGIVDHGKMSAKDLNPTGYTRLPTYTLQLEVNCDAPIAFGLKTVDNRRGSASTSGFGLGFINDSQKLGVFTVTMRTPVADGDTVQPIASYDNGTTWEPQNWMEDFGLYSVSTDGVLPRPTEDLTMGLEVATLIARTDGMDLSDEVNIDGSATIEMMYL